MTGTYTPSRPRAAASDSPGAGSRGRTLLDSWSRELADRRFWLIAGALLLLALAVRVVYVLHTPHFVANQDAHSYDFLAQTLAKGHGWGYGTSAYRPPGYPFFLAGIYLLVGLPHGVYTDARLVEAVFSTVTVALIGLMAWQVAGRLAGLIALAIAALYLPLVMIGVSLMSESLFVLVVLAATNCALRARVAARRYPWIVAAGFFSGLAALTRGNGIVIGLALAVMVWTLRPRRSWQSLAAPLVLLVAMALTISPWTIRNYNAQHAFIPVTTELGTTLGGTYNDRSAHLRWVWVVGGYHNYDKIKKTPHLTGAERDRRLISGVLHYIGQHPLSVPEVTFWNTMRLLDLQGRRVSRMTAKTDTDASANVADVGVVIFWIVGALAIIGAVALARGAPASARVPRSLWAVPLLMWATIAPIVSGTPRHRSAIDPFVILLAAFAVQALAEAVVARRARRRDHGGDLAAAAPAG